MRRRKRNGCIAAALFVAALSARTQNSLPAGPVTVTPTAPAPAQPATLAYPYDFTNFVWWTDTELHTDLQRRMRRMPDAIVAGSPEYRKLHDTLMKMLKSKGIHAEVQSTVPSATVRIALNTSGHAQPVPPRAIHFSVAEPPRIAVGKVTVQGGPPGAAHGLEALASSTEGRVYSRLWFPSVEDEARTGTAGFGYLDATAKLVPGAAVSDAKDAWTVPLTLAVTPGTQFHVRSVKVDGGPLLEGRNLNRFVALHPGDVATPNGFARLEIAERQFYGAHGYVDVSFRAEPTLDRERGLADYDFVTVPGPQYTLRKLTIENLYPAQEGEVRAALGLQPGKPFDLTALAKLRTALKSSPGLIGEDFNYTYLKEPKAGVVDVRLEFTKH